MLEVKGLKKQFGQQTILNGINIDALPGSITVIKGENGSGKTTLLKCLSGLLSFEEGKLYLNGQILKPSESDWREIVGFAPNSEGSFFPQLSLWQNIQFFSKLFKKSTEIEALIELLELKPWLQKSYQTCSSGIKKRMAVIRALSHQPQVLLLDEPLSHLDENFKGKIEKAIEDWTRNEKIITLITTNEKTSIGDQTLVMDGGQCA